MTGTRSLMHVGLVASRWILPLIGILLVSATVAYAISGGLTGSSATPYGWPAASTASPVREVRGIDPSAADDAMRDYQGSCASLFGSYNFWLYNQDQRGPCGLAAASEERTSAAP
jgi:hypothetical protein